MIILEQRADRDSILMQMVFRITFFISIMGFSSCFLPPKWAKSITDRHQVDASEYFLSNQKFIFNDIIDTNALYVNEHVWVNSSFDGKYVNDHNLLYAYFRFSNTGICTSQIYLHDKPVDSLINIGQTIGQYGFYTIRDKDIIVERYNFDHHIFEYIYLKLQENGDLFHCKTKGRPFGTYTEHWNFLYKKQPAKFTQPLVFPK